MRLFFGLQPDSDTVLNIAAWRDRTLPVIGSPIPVVNLHITLAFCGEVKQRSLVGLETLAGQIDQPVIQLHIDQLGFFPKPGILWIGPSTWPDHLTALSRSLNQASRRLGLGSDRRPYQPHISINRNVLHAPPTSTEAPDFHLGFDHFILFRSDRLRSGMRYQPIAGFDLSRTTL